MTELILHHYPISPFAEKARLMLGYKGLAWRSVHIPVVMPKPDVVALTGGYRKTPLLQIGADVYCDTALIARLLDRLQAEPALFPRSAPLAEPLAQWADSHLFWCAVIHANQPAGAAALFDGIGGSVEEAVAMFRSDRASFATGTARMSLHEATIQLKRHLAALAAQLAAGGPYLLGAAPCIADFSVAHCLWFLRRARLPQLLDAQPALNAWLDRMLAIGHGQATPMDSAQALAVAAAAASHAACTVEPGGGFEAGQVVRIAATDYGVEPVVGTLVGLSADEAVLERRDERAGTLHVHFPRAGFHLRKERKE